MVLRGVAEVAKVVAREVAEVAEMVAKRIVAAVVAGVSVVVRVCSHLGTR